MSWIVRKLRGTRVFVRTGPDGKPEATEDGRVEILYKLDSAAKIYRAAVGNLIPTGNPDDDTPIELEHMPAPATVDKDVAAAAASTAGAAVGAAAAPADVVVIYTDGSCTGNPGPAGLGAVILDGGERRELSEYLGEGTNNIAELTAILRALQEVSDRSRPVWLHSDSNYSIGLLTKGWKAKANQDLVARIREEVAKFPRLQFIKVPAHSGVPENERADELARLAVERRA